jgi:hypothetical protein
MEEKKKANPELITLSTFLEDATVVSKPDMRKIKRLII